MALNPVKIYASQGKVVFESDGRTIDPKFLGTLVASSVETNRIKIDRTDVTDANGNPRNVFRRMINTRVQNVDGEELVGDLGYTQAEVIDYLNRTFNQPATAGALLMGISQSIEFSLDATRTTILTSIGASYAVNSIKAYEQDNGLIGIALFSATDVIEDDLYTDIYPANVTISGTAAATNVADCVNEMNALFFQTGAPTILTQGSTIVLDNGTQVTYDIGSDVTASGGKFTTAVTTQTDQHWVATNETIDAEGEFFTVILSDNTASSNTGSLDTWGLIDTASTLWTDRDTTGLPFNGAYAAHVYGGYNGPWTSVYPNVALQPLTVWSTSAEYTNYFAGTGVLFRCGINADGYGIWGFWSAADSEWKDMYRTPQPLTVGPEYAMYFTPRYGDANVVMHDTQASTQVFEQDPTSPPSTYYYIENADGTYDYPLFATSTEAEQYDTSQGGAGASVVEVYSNDAVTGRQWRAPVTGFQDDTVTPPSGLVATWNEIPTTPAVTVPDAYPANTVTVNELASVNINIHPVGATYTTTVTNLPSGLTQSGDFIIGTAPEVTSDYVTNPSDDYTVTITRSNSAGSSQGTLTIRVTNLTAPATALTGATWVSGTTPLVDSDTLDEGSAVTLDNTLADGQRFVVPQTWTETYVLPQLQAVGDEVFFGVQASGANLADGSDYADFDMAIVWEYTSATAHTVNFIANGSRVDGVTVNSMTDAVYDFGFELNGTTGYILYCNVGSINTEPSPADGGQFTFAESATSMTGPLTFTIATNLTTLDLDLTSFSEITTPTAPTSSTNWTKAVAFTGGSEHTRQANNSGLYAPLAMAGNNTTIAAPTAGQTTATGHPWATAVVFRVQGNASNQHIWNYGEGAGSTDDNIYLRLDSSRNLYFGWGRAGALNELHFGSGLSTSAWYGVYIAHNGTRLSGANATSANLADAFEIRYVNLNTGSAGSSLSTPANWASASSTTGGRMDYQFSGAEMTVGGRGSNRNLHGEVAAMVVTTLRNGVAMPDVTEIGLMVTDPVKWLDDYKVGNAYRRSPATGDTANFAYNSYDSAYATGVYLFGDTPSDAYPVIYNYVHPISSQNTRWVMQNMVSSDIINVSIPGL